MKRNASVGNLGEDSLASRSTGKCCAQYTNISFTPSPPLSLSLSLSHPLSLSSERKYSFQEILTKICNLLLWSQCRIVRYRKVYRTYKSSQNMLHKYARLCVALAFINRECARTCSRVPTIGRIGDGAVKETDIIRALLKQWKNWHVTSGESNEVLQGYLRSRLFRSSLALEDLFRRER